MLRAAPAMVVAGMMKEVAVKVAVAEMRARVTGRGGGGDVEGGDGDRLVW